MTNYYYCYCYYYYYYYYYYSFYLYCCASDPACTIGAKLHMQAPAFPKRSLGGWRPMPATATEAST